MFSNTEVSVAQLSLHHIISLSVSLVNDQFTEAYLFTKIHD